MPAGCDIFVAQTDMEALSFGFPAIPTTLLPDFANPCRKPILVQAWHLLSPSVLGHVSQVYIWPSTYHTGQKAGCFTSWEAGVSLPDLEVTIKLPLL